MILSLVNASMLGQGDMLWWRTIWVHFVEDGRAYHQEIRHKNGGRWKRTNYVLDNKENLLYYIHH